MPRFYSTLPIPSQVNTRGWMGFCNLCSGLITRETALAHDNFHQTFTNRRDGNMSTVLWCDPGNHPFKAGAPGSIHYQGSQVTEDGNTENAAIDACAEHNPLAPANVRETQERLRLTSQAETELRGHNYD